MRKTPAGNVPPRQRVRSSCRCQLIVSQACIVCRRGQPNKTNTDVCGGSIRTEGLSVTVRNGEWRGESFAWRLASIISLFCQPSTHHIASPVSWYSWEILVVQPGINVVKVSKEHVKMSSQSTLFQHYRTEKKDKRASVVQKKADVPSTKSEMCISSAWRENGSDARHTSWLTRCRLGYSSPTHNLQTRAGAGAAKQSFGCAPSV